MELLDCPEVLGVLEPRVCLEPLVWMDLMASVEPKASQEHQVGAQEVAQVPLVFQG